MIFKSVLIVGRNLKRVDVLLKEMILFNALIVARLHHYEYSGLVLVGS